jgi:hypothetical protein
MSPLLEQAEEAEEEEEQGGAEAAPAAAKRRVKPRIGALLMALRISCDVS